MNLEFTSKNRDLLNAYRQESFEALADIETATARLKEIIETAAESTGIAKNKIGAYYKAEFKEKVETTQELAEFFSFMREKEE